MKIDNDLIRYQKLKNIYLLKLALLKDDLHNYIITIFNDEFIEPIKQLIKENPKDKLNEDSSKFWSGIRRFPKVLNIEVNNNLLVEFTNYFGKLLHNSLNLGEFIIDIQNLKYKDLTVNTISFDNFNEMEFINKIYDISNILDKKIIIQELEKDDDTNNHINFITIVSNIRADIYNIEKTDFLNCKLIAGKITPALSTTTTFITGLSTMEILKYVFNKIHGYSFKKIDYQDCYINTGINLFIQSKPNKPIKIFDGSFNQLYGTKVKTIPDSFNTWDREFLTKKGMGIINLNDLLAYIQDKYEITLDLISCGDHIIYSKYSDNENINIGDIYKKLGKLNNDLLELDIACIAENGQPILIPKIIYSQVD